MRTLTLLLLLLSFSLAGGSFQPVREVEFWRGTGFGLDAVRQFISNDLCYKTEALFTSCQEAFSQAEYMTLPGTFQFIRAAGFDRSRVNFDQALKQVEYLASREGAFYPPEMVFSKMVNEQMRFFDPHALLETVDALNARLAGPTQQTTGIGIEEEINAEGVFVRLVHPDTPAQASGLMVNDRIVALNGVKTPGGIKAVGAMKALAGKPGKLIEIQVERAGHPLNLRVAVTRLSLQNVTWEFPRLGKQTFALVRMRNFAIGSCEMIRDVLSVGRSSGVILDLRWNLGGQTGEAACLLNLFLQNQKLVERRPVGQLLPAEFHQALLPRESAAVMDGGSRKAAKATGAPFASLPLVVLVNSASASASEMFAAAIQDYKRGWVVGEPTFGKGSTQTVSEPAAFRKLRLIYTVSRYHRPSGGSIQLIGVEPNFVIPFQRSATPAQRQFLREAEVFGDRLGKEPGPQWAETRRAKIERVTKCIRARGYDDMFFDWHLRMYGHEDYQRSFALAVMLCKD